MLSVRRLAAAGAKLEVGPRMTESSDTSDTPAKPQDYAGLRAELAMLVDDFSPVTTSCGLGSTHAPPGTKRSLDRNVQLRLGGRLTTGINHPVCWSRIWAQNTAKSIRTTATQCSKLDGSTSLTCSYETDRTGETATGWLITQRSQVRILPGPPL